MFTFFHFLIQCRYSIILLYRCYIDLVYQLLSLCLCIHIDRLPCVSAIYTVGNSSAWDLYRVQGYSRTTPHAKSVSMTKCSPCMHLYIQHKFIHPQNKHTCPIFPIFTTSDYCTLRFKTFILGHQSKLTLFGFQLLPQLFKLVLFTA